MFTNSSSGKRRRFVHGTILVTVCSCLMVGCASSRLVKVRPNPHNPLREKLKLSAWQGPKPSERTVQILRRYDLLNTGNKFLGRNSNIKRGSLAQLSEFYERDPKMETCYALAELNYLEGKRLELSHGKQSMQHYFTCVLYAYEYLFQPKFRDHTNPYDPQFRGACDLYNVALEEALRQAQKQGQLKPGTSTIETVGGQRVRFDVRARGFNWRPQEFDQFKFVSDYKLTGLTNKYETYGLGVPLIAVRSKKTGGAVQEKYYAPNLSFPITAFLRLKKDRNNANSPILAELELHDPTEKTNIQVANYEIPLESDISTPLAFFLDNPKLRHLDTYGLVRADKAKEISGLYMVQPYQPGKIPVLMVHGLWSSPMTWMEMMNDLRGVPEIRDRYQFLFYLYPSGQPFWETTADLRDSLKELQQTFSGMDQDHQLDQMVVVGHSMGGLVSRMLTSYGGDVYWNKVSQKPITQVSGSEQLKRLFYFSPERSVKRVVTIGSPHRGSNLANNFTRWLGRKLISLPGHTLDAGKSIVTLDPHGLFEDIAKATSIDSLSPNSPILQANAESKKAEWVTYHNVVGITSGKPLEENSDGIVPYTSAHLTNVDSEILVNAEHSAIHRHPKTVLEVQRILMQHLQVVDAKKYSEVIHAGREEGHGHSLPQQTESGQQKRPMVIKPSLPQPRFSQPARTVPADPDWNSYAPSAIQPQPNRGFSTWTKPSRSVTN